ncbi:MAG: TrmH family RNA methyltransferase [Candidatus Zambryskibacteria bacterium]|nr:TrmH family RNA methyltransferase [Candidatus Zambryskibacteria bacterium]
MVKNKTCVLILENLRSVENTASIFRTAEGLGVSKIILVGTTPAPVDRFGRKRKDFAKVSLGSEDMMDWEYVSEDNFQFTISNLQNDGFKIITLEQDPKARKLKSFEANKLERFALIVGNEVDGVSKVALDNSDEIVEIPMQGKKESLNVSVSTGIALFVLLPHTK